jgi:predicted dithiol-disulfide oxidoreductase (DUF899 family)
MIEQHAVVSKEEWIEARKRHLVREKAFTRMRDELSAERRALPWVRVEKVYRFQTAAGERTLAQLFEGCSQLVIYHFMLGPDWEEGCKSCSFWADNFNGIDVHLRHRDVTLIAVSLAPLERIECYRQRMGWGFTWVSSAGSDFNRDYHVSFSTEELREEEVEYNYRMIKLTMGEQPGISVFRKDPAGTVFHTYSCYSRGLDMLNGAYHYLDLVPKGRDEAGLRQHNEWLRRHDRYED